jgi:hypothetical protein
MRFNQIEHGHIYILQNPAFPADMLKIGKTRGSVYERAHRLSRVTGVPEDFVVAYSREVWDIAQAEDMIFSRLDAFRPRYRKEFFRLPLAAAIAAADEVITGINSREPETLAERRQKWRDWEREMDEQDERERLYYALKREFPDDEPWMHAQDPPDD